MKTLRVVLERSRAEKWLIGIGLTILLETCFFGARTTLWRSPFTLTCDRGAVCTLAGNDVFGTHWQSSFPTEMLKSSDVVERRHGTFAWMVTLADGHTRDLGNATARRQQIDAYRAHSQRLQTFAGDSTQIHFAVSFEGLGGPGLPVFIVIVLVLLAILVPAIARWRVTLVFDDTTLLVARRQIPLAELARAELRSGWFGNFRTLKLQIVDQRDRCVFSRVTFFSKAAAAELALVVRDINEVLGPA